MLIFVRKVDNPQAHLKELKQRIGQILEEHALESGNWKDQGARTFRGMYNPAIPVSLEEIVITFEDLFNLNDIQQIQDEFSSATGVASIITKPDGTPITRQSNFTRFCNDIVRKNERGCEKCFESETVIGSPHPEGPYLQVCQSGGLWVAGVSTIIGGRHIANWLIGQVRTKAQNEESVRAFTREIGEDEEVVLGAFSEVPEMSQAQFQAIAQALFTYVNQISKAAYQNIMQARSIIDLKRIEGKLQRKNEELQTANELIAASEEEFRINLDTLIRQEQLVRESEEQFQALFMNIIEGSALHDLVYNDQGVPEDYIIRMVNPAFESHLGISCTEVLGKTSREAYGVITPPILIFIPGLPGPENLKYSRPFSSP